MNWMEKCFHVIILKLVSIGERNEHVFKVDRLQIILVAKKYKLYLRVATVHQ